MSESGRNDRLPLVIAVTGHRNLCADERPGLHRAVREFLIEMRDRFPDRRLQLLTPLAEGADQLAADVALELELEVIAVLPMEVGAYRADFGTPASLRDFDQRLARMHEVIELLHVDGGTADALEATGSERDAQYAQLGVFLAAHCHLLLAIWDGKPSDHIGGTGDVVRFHHDSHMPGYTDSVFATQQMLIDDESDLVYHVVCSRDQDGGRPAPGLVPLETWWYSKDAEAPRSRSMPAQHEAIFARSAEFSRDRMRHAELIEQDAHPLAGTAGSSGLPAHVAAIDDLFCTADVLAVHYQRKVLRTLRVTHFLAFFMGLSFILYADVQTERAFMVVFLGLFMVSAAIQAVAKRGQWHRKYLDYRALAEGLRVQFYWAVAGVCDENDSLFVHDNFLRTQDPEVGWIRNEMRVAGLRSDAARSREQRGLEFVLREWIGDDSGGQLAYFNRRTADRVRWNRLTEALGVISLLTSVAMILMVVLIGDRLSEAWIGPLLATMGALLLVYGIRQGYAYALAEKELIKQYRFMQRLFGNARLRLDQAASPFEQRHILRALGRAALDEHSEWLVMHRSRSVEQSDIWRMGS
ncbi:hypothetical protein HFP89_10570 [Wenzhouxiangella sp. XN79A]|uniref:hypothetical protein n=1 Tax=Wenzhouxiangella sp. XN79A TaxID=2724193 RepID=UPI00144AE8EE|nr:hypothetical protein [Wenzhouxiangella sp. XN79A]NKI35607.1 hypothetical protein [Wenzhouxiangella sp. XN79A]